MGVSLKINDYIYVLPENFLNPSFKFHGQFLGLIKFFYKLENNLELCLGYNKVIIVFCEPLISMKNNKKECCRIIRKWDSNLDYSLFYTEI